MELFFEKVLEKLTGSQPVLIAGMSGKREGIAKLVIEELKISRSDLAIFSSDQPVAQLREIIGNLSVKPHSSQYRLLIIKDADKINSQSANTLLKNLEEPPSYQRTILFCNSFSAVLATIKSRCKKLVLPDKHLANEGEDLTSFFDSPSFIDFSKYIEKKEATELGEIVANTLEVMRLKGLNKTEEHLYKDLASAFIKISSSNINPKIKLEEVYLKFLQKNARNNLP